MKAPARPSFTIAATTRSIMSSRLSCSRTHWRPMGIGRLVKTFWRLVVDGEVFSTNEAQTAHCPRGRRAPPGSIPGAVLTKSGEGGTYQRSFGEARHRSRSANHAGGRSRPGSTRRAQHNALIAFDEARS
jgi:hypothetical protein